jgi:uncharacterized membrane protein YfcA
METYIILLCAAAFAAGFIDAIVGGGGLIQTPAGLILLPNLPVSTVIGTLKYLLSAELHLRLTST